MPERKTYDQFVADIAGEVSEIFPWDLEEVIEQEPDLLLLDIRERAEFEAAHIAGALNVPRGILEPAADYGYIETEPELMEARDRPVVVICRSGRRSALAADTLQQMGFENVRTLKLGVKGWNDSEYPLVAGRGESISPDDAETHVAPEIPPEKLGPKS